MNKGQRHLNDPEVLEDVEFLLAAGCHIDEIARRCNVGRAALEKRYPFLRPRELA